MIRIATKGLHWELLAPDDWEGDPAVQGVIHQPAEQRGWRVPIGEALARGFHPTRSRVQAEPPPNITPSTSGDGGAAAPWSIIGMAATSQPNTVVAKPDVVQEPRSVWGWVIAGVVMSVWTFSLFVTGGLLRAFPDGFGEVFSSVVGAVTFSGLLFGAFPTALVWLVAGVKASTTRLRVVLVLVAAAHFVWGIFVYWFGSQI